MNCLNLSIENFSAFEVDEELLPNLREYSLANAIFWGLAEGHACEISARRNAMDVSEQQSSCGILGSVFLHILIGIQSRTPPRTLER